MCRLGSCGAVEEMVPLRVNHALSSATTFIFWSIVVVVNNGFRIHQMAVRKPVESRWSVPIMNIGRVWDRWMVGEAGQVIGSWLLVTPLICPLHSLERLPLVVHSLHQLEMTEGLVWRRLGSPLNRCCLCRDVLLPCIALVDISVYCGKSLHFGYTPWCRTCHLPVRFCLVAWQQIRQPRRDEWSVHKCLSTFHAKSVASCFATDTSVHKPRELVCLSQYHGCMYNAKLRCIFSLQQMFGMNAFASLLSSILASSKRKKDSFAGVLTQVDVLAHPEQWKPH